MFPELIKIGDFSIHTYGVLVALGILSAYFISIYLAKKENLPINKIENLFIFITFGGIIGARIAYMLEHPQQMKSIIDYIAIWKGGIDWFGAFIGGALTAIFLIKIYKLNFWKLSDIAGVAIPLGHFFGRIGCTCAGCCHGKPVSDDSIFKEFAIKFPDNPNTVAPPNIPLYPTQPAEALGNLAIFGLLFFLYKYKRFDGQVFSIYLILYGILRFLLEFWRGVTPPIDFIGLTWNQIVAILLIVSGISINVYKLFIKRYHWKMDS